MLEVGVGSGVLVPTLTRSYAEYTGTDLTLASGLEALVAPGCQATFRAANLLTDGDLPADAYDAIVCFSVLEHIADSDGAAASLARALAPGGTLVTGYPMVSPRDDPRVQPDRLPRHRRPPRQPARAHHRRPRPHAYVRSDVSPFPPPPPSAPRSTSAPPGRSSSPWLIGGRLCRPETCLPSQIRPRLSSRSGGFRKGGRSPPLLVYTNLILRAASADMRSNSKPCFQR